MVIVIPATTTTGVLKYEWLDPGGTLRDLTYRTSPNLFVSRGAIGLGSPPVELVTEKLPFAAGSLVRYSRTSPLQIELPLVVQATTFTQMIERMEALRDWFDTGDERRRTPGYLRITRPDDTVRQVACYYAGGLEGDLGPGGVLGTPVVVSLLAPDPYWTDTASSEIFYDPADLDFTAGVAPTQSMINPGQFDAYPIWTCHGPMRNVGINNVTTGEGWGLASNGGITLGVGEIVTIDTRPATQRTTLPVLDGGGNSHFSKLTANSELWWLTPGENEFTIGFSLGDGVNTAVTLTFLPRYRGVLR